MDFITRLPFIKAYFVFLLLLLVCYTFSVAQTCNGSLGEPAVNITFGAGRGSAKPLSGNITSYNYATASCPDDGFYIIASQSLNCFGNTWHSVTEDHTAGDKDGNMMLINASFTAGDFYKETVKGLCAGTTYEFAAWILNILKVSACQTDGIDPNITFTIENTSGRILNSYSTGDIPEKASSRWEQYGFYFTADADEVVIRMTNNAAGGCGNDLALDDITFRACGPKISAEAKTTSANNVFCEGAEGTVILDAPAAEGYINPSYQWQVNSNDGEGWMDLAAASQRSYTLNIPAINAEGYQFRLAVAEGLNINSANCRVFSDVIPVDVNKSPTADAGENLVIDEGAAVILNGKAEGKRYFWTPSNYLDNPNVLNPVASPPETTIYTLHVTSEDGCNKMAEDQVSIRVLKKIVVPNAFTPNGDMVNDRWKIASLDTYPEARIRVFNRYGQAVFQSQGYTQEWDGSSDGRALPTGVYYYVIDLKVRNQPLKGSVSILR